MYVWVCVEESAELQNSFTLACITYLIHTLSYPQHLTGGVNGGVHVTDVTNASRTMLNIYSTVGPLPLQVSHVTCK